MAVQRKVNFLSQQRIDLPDLRSIESSASNDFDQLIQAFVTNTSQGYFVRGFNINIAGAIGGAANGLQLNVYPGAILHINASQSGTIMNVPSGTPAQVLNATTNANVIGAFSPNATNYVTLDYTRFIDPATSAQVYLWDPTTNTETTENAPRAQILEFVINISTQTPTSNLLPIATVVTDGNNNVLSIQDDRNLIGRLGSGGITPNPNNVYGWPQGQIENSSITNGTNALNDPFYGGDKSIDSLKSWMDAVMSSIKGIQGTTYWYSPINSGSLNTLREDLGNTVITGSGNISHGIIPNSTPLLVTTGNISPGSNQLVSLASTAGIVNGDYVFATGIPSGTVILNISGSTVTLSQDATLSGTGISVSFYSPSVITSPGQINWDQPIEMAVIGSSLNYVLNANKSTTDIVLSDDQAAYVTLTRNASISPNLIFTNGSPTVSSVGSVAWTSNLQSGDYVRLASDTDANYYKIQTVNNLYTVTLSSNFTGTSTGSSGASALYAFGIYYASSSPVGDPRAIQIASRKLVPNNGNVFWLFLREDNGGAPRVYIRFLGAEIDNGEDREVSGTTSEPLLQYTGAFVASASAPQYVSAINPNSIHQITSITVGAASTLASNEYFFIYSAGNYRQYYVWINKDGSGTDPKPLLNSIGIQWVVSTGQTNSQTAASLALALEGTFFQDFSATSGAGTVTVTNNSAGLAASPVNFNVGAPFSASVSQFGTGNGTYAIQDGQNLTLAIAKLDSVVGSLAAVQAGYDEIVTVVSSGATPPSTINGPVSSGTNIQLPPNSRNSNIQVYYAVGSGKLEIFLNGQKLIVNSDYSEVGLLGAPSDQIQILQTLEVSDELEFTFGGGGAGGGGGGEPGPPGPAGPQGPPGADAAGGPVSISTKTSNYTVLPGDCFLLANCSSGSVTFTLPPAASEVGNIFYFKKIDSTSNAMNIQGYSSQTIDGINLQTTNVQFETFSIISDGSQWWIF